MTPRRFSSLHWRGVHLFNALSKPSNNLKVLTGFGSCGFFEYSASVIRFLAGGLINRLKYQFCLVRFIVKMVVGRGSGLPRQSARRLAGFFTELLVKKITN